MSTDRYPRWRLVLGRAADQDLCRAAGCRSLLSGDAANLDEALGQIYENKEEGTSPKQRSAGLGASAPRLAKWLGDIRGYFSKDVVSVIQKDAIERKGLKQLLFEPETLGQVTPDVGLVGTLLSLKNLIPERAKEAAREVVRAVVEEIMKRLRGGVEQAVRGALDRSRHSPMRSLPNLDWARTIRRNLKNYDRERKVVVPESFHFFARQPIDLLFGVQLGGGTDINRAVAYCQKLVHDPRKTLFLLITDLFEGGNARELVRRMDDLRAAGVRAICLLALSDSGVPCHDENMARRFTEVGVPCFGCTPKMLPVLLEGTLKGQDLYKLAKTCGVQVEQSG
jgi:hypothetical protein